MTKKSDINRHISQYLIVALKKAAISIQEDVVYATPVDTGRARSNWQVDVNEIAVKELPPYVPGKKGSTAAGNTAAALKAGEKSMRRVNKTSDTIYLVNTLPYIAALNFGTSAQAPEMFIQSSIQTGLESFRRLEI